MGLPQASAFEFLKSFKPELKETESCGGTGCSTGKEAAFPAASRYLEMCPLFRDFTACPPLRIHRFFMFLKYKVSREYRERVLKPLRREHVTFFVMYLTQI
jgi:hypothetical protein